MLADFNIARQYTTLDTSSSKQEVGDNSTREHLQHSDDHQEPTQPALLPVGVTESPPTDGVLIGLPPTIFDGDRSQTSYFISQFDLYREINPRHKSMTNPAERVALACNCIRGPKVHDWAADQIDALHEKVFGDANSAPTRADTDEALWHDFIAEFQRVFTDPGAKENAIAELRTPEMTGEDIQDYILAFEGLLMEAGWERDTVETVDYFRDGLPTNLHRHVLNRDHTPVTLDEWESAAQVEVEKTRRIRAFLRPEERGRRGKREPDTVETGVIRTSRLSEKERARLLKEGTCSSLSGQAHWRSRFQGRGRCGSRKWRNWARRARIDEGMSQGEEKEEDASTANHDVDSLVAQIKQMRAGDREELMDMLAREGWF